MEKLNLVIALLLSFFTIGIKAQSHTETLNNDRIGKALIVYLSRTNNTKVLAEMIHKNVGGDLVALELQNPYPENYQKTVDQVAEENRTDFLPRLKTKIEKIDQYDTIFIGFPTWGMQLPPPMKSFFKLYDLKDKTVIPFNTNAGYGTGNSFDTVKTLCGQSKVLQGFSIEGGKEKDGVLFVMKGKRELEVNKSVKEWLRRKKLIK